MTLCGWKIFSKSKQKGKRGKNDANPPRSGTGTPTTEPEPKVEESAVPIIKSQVTEETKGSSQESINEGDSGDDGNPRNKCALKPGHSLIDWIRLGSSGCDLAGTKGIISPVSTAELSKHNKKDDAWLAIRGKVYNVTHYMEFHPGGPDELMKGVGQDATKIFDDIHAWVNYDQLLSKCYVGPLRNTAVLNLEPLKFRQKTPSANGSSNKSSILPFFGSNSARSSPSKSRFDSGSRSSSDEKPEIIPRFDWIQKTSDLFLVFYTKPFCNPGIILTYKSDSELVVRIVIERTTHLCSFKLAHDVDWPCSVKLFSETGKIEITILKSRPQLWTTFGSMDRQKLTSFEDLEFNFQIASNAKINHDSFALALKPSNRTIFITPIGFHVSLTASIDGRNVTRRYTPVPATYFPVTSSSTYYINLLIKSYTSGVLAKYITSQPLDSEVILTQPKGNFLLSNVVDHCRFGLLAAGSGITPILSVLDHLLGRVNNKVEHIQLMLFNKTEEDIWCRQSIEALAAKDNRLVIRHILSEPQDGWIGETGRIAEELISPLNDPNANCHVTFCCVCGPTPFNDLAEKLLRESGFEDSNLHFFQG